MKQENWTPEPTDHDFPSAQAYLSLVMDERVAAATVSALRRGTPTTHRVNDVLRASRLALLPPTENEVAKNLKKVRKGIKLSPVLLVRGDPTVDRPLIIADGYHRVCAGYNLNPDEPVHCIIVDLATATPTQRSTATPAARTPARRKAASRR